MLKLSNGRRAKPVMLNGKVGYVVRWTSACSGCGETPENTSPPERGIGCKECGGCGKRRTSVWVEHTEGNTSPGKDNGL